MAASPVSPRAAPERRSGAGCLLVAVALPVVVIVGLVIGAALNQPEGPKAERAVALADGTLAGTEWRVDAALDVDGDRCAFLYADGEQLAGACSPTPQDATFGERTVIFGRAASTADAVSVRLSDGRSVEISTQAADGIEGRYYVEVVAGDVDAVGLAP